MAGSKLNTYSSSYTSLTNYATCIDAQRLGFANVNLSGLSTTSVPTIEAGSIVEIAGAIYQFSTQEPISTGSVTSTEYQNYVILLVPSSSECTARFSTGQPVYRTDYHGWYASSSDNIRAIGSCVYCSSGYINKYVIGKESEIKTVVEYSTVINVTLASSAYTTIPYTDVRTDPLNQYSTTTYLFTARRAGVYTVAAYLRPYGMTSTNTSILMATLVNSTYSKYGGYDLCVLCRAGAYPIPKVNNSIYLSSGDTISVTVFLSDSTQTVYTSQLQISQSAY